MTTDHFSSIAEQYARFRPTYPAALFDFLAGLGNRSAVWDCGCGNGQATLALAGRFRQVWASDISLEQVNRAPAVDSVEWFCGRAEQSPLPDQSVELITVGQAWHWFDAARFEQEAARILRPRGYLAVWTYNLMRIDPQIDILVQHYYSERLGRYWPPERRILEQAYPDFPLQLKPHPTPQFDMYQDWALPQLLGYLSSWSAAEKARQAEGVDPLMEFAPILAQAWGDPERVRRINWPLRLKLARKELS